MKKPLDYDRSKLDELCNKIGDKKAGVFNFAIVDYTPLQKVIAGDILKKFPKREVQIIDFSSEDFVFSSSNIRDILKDETRILLLVNFQLSPGDLDDSDFFGNLNLSRDPLADLPCVLVFMMPLYFRVQIARNSPDFNTFVWYRIDFESDFTDHVFGKTDKIFEFESIENYSPAKKDLLEYYVGEYSSLINQESEEAFEIILKILTLNSEMYALHLHESRRFYEQFLLLLGEFNTKGREKDISYIFTAKGEYDRALEWCQKDVLLKEEIYGKDHLDTASSYLNASNLFSLRGDLQDSLEWAEKALFIRINMLGDNHPDTAATYGRQALTYQCLGNYAKALELNYKALEIREKVLGKDHIETANTYNNIATVYTDMRDYSKSIKFLHQARYVCEKLLGENHPISAATYNNIGSIHASKGNFNEAFRWVQKCYQICTKTLGENHPNTLTAKNSMEAYRNRG